jgi:proteasome lid subunit RPN8/RPN11
MSDIKSALLEFVEADDLRLEEPELCGLVLTDGTVVQLSNIHPEPQNGFHMDPEQLLARLDDAVATWHTHPGRDPNLSEEDMSGFRAWPSLTHHIVGIRDGEPTVHSFAVLDDDVVVSL